MITVQWPSTTSQVAEVWRVLDLSGMTKSVRQSKNYTKAGFVYLNGQPIRGLKQTMTLGQKHTLELRFPSGKIVSQDVFLRSRSFSSVRNPRSLEPTDIRYRG